MRLFRSPVNAPRFPEPRDWINVEQAPTMAALIGTGTAGRQDGSFDAAQLHEPEGWAWLDHRLHIADTNNHSVRVADLPRKSVITLDLE